MEYPEDKVIISRSKLEAMEAELAAYKNSRQHKPVCDLLPQQRDTDSPLLFFHRICYADDDRACTDSFF